MIQIKKRKNGRPVLAGIFSSIFFMSFLTIAREMPKAIEKS